MLFKTTLLAAAAAVGPALATDHHNSNPGKAGLTCGSINLYWGQYGVEDRLSSYCDAEGVNSVSISFVTYSPKNSGGFPGTNFAGHCGAEVFYKNPQTGKDTKLIMNCDAVKQDIKHCQSKGVKVLLAIGGYCPPGGPCTYDISTPQEGHEFGELLHKSFGPYDSSWNGPRPFDISATEHIAVDGFDFDIEFKYADQSPWITMVEKLRNCGSYYISAAPQCPTADEWFQLKELIYNVKFDALFIQFFNNAGCQASDSPNYDDWEDVIAETSKSKDAKLYIGVLANPEAGSTGYAPPSKIKELICKHKDKPHFGGVSIWDAARSTSNQINGQAFHEAIADALKYGCNSIPGQSSTVAATISATTVSASVAVSSAPYAMNGTASATNSATDSASNSATNSASVAATDSVSAAASVVASTAPYAMNGTTSATDSGFASAASATVSSTDSASLSATDSVSTAPYAANGTASDSGFASPTGASVTDTGSASAAGSATVTGTASSAISGGVSATTSCTDSSAPYTNGTASDSGHAPPTGGVSATDSGSASIAASGATSAPYAANGTSTDTGYASPTGAGSATDSGSVSAATTAPYAANGTASAPYAVNGTATDSGYASGSGVATPVPSGSVSVLTTMPWLTNSTATTSGVASESDTAHPYIMPTPLNITSNASPAVTPTPSFANGTASALASVTRPANATTTRPANATDVCDEDVDFTMTRTRYANHTATGKPHHTKSRAMTTITGTTPVAYTVTSCAPNTPCTTGAVYYSKVPYTTVVPVKTKKSKTAKGSMASGKKGPITSTAYTTRVYTITSCAPTVTNCPVGKVTTEVSPYTTVINGKTKTGKKTPSTKKATTSKYVTSTVYKTNVYTITSCAATVTNCPVGKVTTEVVVAYTTVCPATMTDNNGNPPPKTATKETKTPKTKTKTKTNKTATKTPGQNPPKSTTTPGQNGNPPPKTVTLTKTQKTKTKTKTKTHKTKSTPAGNPPKSTSVPGGSPPPATAGGQKCVDCPTGTVTTRIQTTLTVSVPVVKNNSTVPATGTTGTTAKPPTTPGTNTATPTPSKPVQAGASKIGAFGIAGFAAVAAAFLL